MTTAFVQEKTAAGRLLQYHDLIQSIVATMDARDAYTARHSERVADMVLVLAAALGLDETSTTLLHIAAHLHDIGKIAIGDAVLNKVGPFSVAERQEMETHAEIGYRILSTNHDMVEIADYVLAHHEHWDGKGYPKGLSGPQIPLPARICAIADAYDAMTSPSHYQPTRSAAGPRQNLSAAPAASLIRSWWRCLWGCEGRINTKKVWSSSTPGVAFLSFKW